MEIACSGQWGGSGLSDLGTKAGDRCSPLLKKLTKKYDEMMTPKRDVKSGMEGPTLIMARESSQVFLEMDMEMDIEVGVGMVRGMNGSQSDGRHTGRNGVISLTVLVSRICSI